MSFSHVIRHYYGNHSYFPFLDLLICLNSVRRLTYPHAILGSANRQKRDLKYYEAFHPLQRAYTRTHVPLQKLLFSSAKQQEARKRRNQSPPRIQCTISERLSLNGAQQQSSNAQDKHVKVDAASQASKIHTKK